MPDISMCANQTCPSRVHCYRYRARATKHRQAYMLAIEPDDSGKCEYYWSTSGRDDRDLTAMSELEPKETK